MLWSLLAPVSSGGVGVSAGAYIVVGIPSVVDGFEGVGDVAVEVAVFGAVFHEAYQPMARQMRIAVSGTR